MTVSRSSATLAAPPAPRLRRSWLRWLSRTSHALIGIAVLLVLWEAVTWIFRPLPVILPAPSRVVVRVFDLLTTADRWEDLALSMARVLGGFAIGAVSGVALAIVLSRNAFVERSLRYPLVALRFVVPFAWVPIAAYWFGLSEWGKVFVTWYASFFVIVFQVRAGLDAVPSLYVRVAHTFGLTPRQTLRRVVLPAAWPAIVVGLRLGLSLAWVAILAAEMVNANAGIGFFVNYSGQFLATDDVMAGMVVIGLLGFAMDLALSPARPLGAAGLLRRGALNAHRRLRSHPTTAPRTHACSTSPSTTSRRPGAPTTSARSRRSTASTSTSPPEASAASSARAARARARCSTSSPVCRRPTTAACASAAGRSTGRARTAASSSRASRSSRGAR